jgi:aldose 1-epimerase
VCAKYPSIALVLLVAVAAGCQRNVAADAAEESTTNEASAPSPTQTSSTAETALPVETASPAEIASVPQEDPQVLENSSPIPTSSSVPAPTSKLAVEKSPFGQLEDGRDVTLFTIRNAHGLALKMIDYGATVVALEVYDRDGNRRNVVLGFDNLHGYLQRHPYFGSTVGRYCNRIAGGKFTLDGQEYTLATNNGPNHLHGGNVGLDRVLWQAEPIEGFESAGIQFTYDSPDGEEGYPGNLRVTATYLLNNNNELVITLAARTDKATPVNLTNHTYWNLGGAGSGTILGHELTIHADQYLPVNEGLIPTGELADVAGTPFDFRQPHQIGERIGQLKNDPQGYDHCYVLRSGEELPHLAARVRDPKSGRVMEIRTTQPAVQFYSGNFLDGTPTSGNNPQYAGLCVETQHFPDSPNQPTFPNTILKPGETYRHVTVHKFSVE